jgi:hypothetical protein
VLAQIVDDQERIATAFEKYSAIVQAAYGANHGFPADVRGANTKMHRSGRTVSLDRSPGSGRVFVLQHSRYKPPGIALIDYVSITAFSGFAIADDRAGYGRAAASS